MNDSLWDVVVIGAGMGGGAAAYRLCQAGHRVLLLEMGNKDAREQQASGIASELKDPTERIDAGRWPNKIETTIDGRKSLDWPVIGCGVGGSTLVYGAALERLSPVDFEQQERTPEGVPMAWPFSYDEIEPFYLELERILEVRGTRDPLDTMSEYSLLDPPPLNQADQNLFEEMSAANLDPYRLHVGIRYDSGCTECGGQYCAKSCKSDARNRLVLPALETGNLTILDRTVVERLDADSKRVNRIIAKRDGQALEVKGKAIVLATGALNSPKILLNSSNRDWPNGIGNNHDLVGRNLMFHSFDLIAVWPTKRKLSRNGPTRTLATRKFYRSNNTRLGYLHSTGLVAGPDAILRYLHLRFAAGPLRNVPFLRSALRIPAWIASKIFSEATILATLIEDLPNPGNRVYLSPTSPSGIAINYKIPAELKQRTMAMRTLIRENLPNHRMIVINRDVMLNRGHSCGTCRAGDDAATSVVDRDCKIHELNNLFVADGSIMPTSGGINPSLTIGAAAFRVADQITDRLRRGVL